MKHTDAKAVLSCNLLRYLRDEKPTEAEFLAWLGGPDAASIYHVMRKAGFVNIESGRLTLHPDRLSADGRYFNFENQRFHIDGDRVDTVVRRGPPHA